MAKVKLNPVIEGIHGKVGEMVFKTFNGQEISTRMPDRTGIEFTEEQLAQQQKFRLAAVYGKAALADAQTKQVYTDVAARRGVPVFAMTVADFLNPPVVDEIDLSAYTGKIGETISIRASDDVEVKGVTVSIRDTGGTLVEQGAATLTAGSGTWKYTTTVNVAQGQNVVIEVSATDRPGHKATRSEPKT